MSDPSIDNALTTAYITGGFDSTPTAFPNDDFDPKDLDNFNEIYLIPSQSAQASLGYGGLDKESGVFQITLNCKKGTLDGPILARARAVKSYYQQNNILTYGSITVNIKTITIGAGFVSDNWYKIPVSINYESRLNRG